MGALTKSCDAGGECRGREGESQGGGLVIQGSQTEMGASSCEPNHEQFVRTAA
jgi:hypothetical protein